MPGAAGCVEVRGPNRGLTTTKGGGGGVGAGSVTIKALNNSNLHLQEVYGLPTTLTCIPSLLLNSFVSVKHFLDFTIILKAFKQLRFWHLETTPRTILLGVGGHVGGLTERT